MLPVWIARGGAANVRVWNAALVRAPPRSLERRAVRLTVPFLAPGVAFVLALVLGAQACVAPRAAAARPVSPEASAAMADAQAALRAGGEDARPIAREAFERALAAAPDWVAPRRALDEILRADLRALDALASYRAALAAGTGDAATLYLAGRLEGRDGTARFERATQLDPTLAWAWHGLAFRGESGEGRSARGAAQRALSLARDPWERTFFTASLARIEAAATRTDAAVELLEERAADPETAPGDRTALLVQAALTELRAPNLRKAELGGERALALLRSADPTDAEIVDLAAALDQALIPLDSGRVALALAARPGAVRDRLRAEILVQESPSPLALGLLERGLAASGDTAPRGSLLRAARFAGGDFLGATERWLAELPSTVLDAHGNPREPRLARVVETARASSGDARAAEEMHAFCAALVDAGWFLEARAVAARLASSDLDRAVDLDTRALAGLTFLSSTRRLLEMVDAAARGRSSSLATRSSTAAETRAARTGPAPVVMVAPTRADPPRSLDALLAALAPHAVDVRAFRGGDADLEAVRAEFVASPRRSYAGVAEVVHPGPSLSAEDEREGLGSEGAPVGGLSAVLAELGRFGIFGALAGDDPDGTVLPLLALEQRSGVHLGVAWHGTIAWCEGADLPSRAGRRGARIAGAALHEGYWIDVDQVRHELSSWEAVARVFGTSAERVQLALDVRGLVASAGEDGARERTSTSALLDEAERVRLAVLRDRAQPGQALGTITLEELLVVCATHEEGHLCDRTRYLPLWKNWPAALMLLANQGFSPQRVQEELEFRAQLTALAASPDPRVPLAQVLDGVEGGLGATPHASGYARLLHEYLQVLDRAVQRGEFPAIARDRTLVHQLHRLAPEDVRRIAVDLARRKRMVDG